MQRSVADLSVHTLVDRIASDQISPGAGAAGAVALSLSAACGAKAASITLKHEPGDRRLQQALARFRALGGLALQIADSDSIAFARFAHDKTVDAAADLVSTAEALTRLIDALLNTISEVEPLVQSSLTGDLTAARTLAAAARTIQRANEAEVKRQRSYIESGSANH